MDLDTILVTAVEMGASDIHLVAGHPPIARIHTVMAPMDYPIITPESANRLLAKMASETHMPIFDKIGDVLLSFAPDDFDRDSRKKRGQRGILDKLAPVYLFVEGRHTRDMVDSRRPRYNVKNFGTP